MLNTTNWKLEKWPGYFFIGVIMHIADTFLSETFILYHTVPSLSTGIYCICLSQFAKPRRDNLAWLCTHLSAFETGAEPVCAKHPFLLNSETDVK